MNYLGIHLMECSLSVYLDSLCDPTIFLFDVFKGIYIPKLVTSPLADPYASLFILLKFYSLFFRGQYGPL